jgi:hypothetical protein
MHTEDGAAQKNVFPAGQLRVETRANLKQGTNAAVDISQSSRGLGHPSKNLEQRAFARAVSAKDSYDISLANLERHVLERPEMSWITVLAGRNPSEETCWRSECARQYVAEAQVGFPFADTIFFAEIFRSDDNVTHWLDDIGDDALHFLKVDCATRHEKQDRQRRSG